MRVFEILGAILCISFFNSSLERSVPAPAQSQLSTVRQVKPVLEKLERNPLGAVGVGAAGGLLLRYPLKAIANRNNPKSEATSDGSFGAQSGKGEVSYHYDRQTGGIKSGKDPETQANDSFLVNDIPKLASTSDATKSKLKVLVDLTMKAEKEGPESLKSFTDGNDDAHQDLLSHLGNCEFSFFVIEN